MPTKTERILGYLPLTFQAAAGRSALRAVTGAFGGELQAAENSLAALMRAHWVDTADRGAQEIDDLARLGVLYGLAPQEGEEIEEFREHLKRFVHTFLDGTVTVRGILRVTAETLGLHLSEDLDAWWNRAEELLVTVEPRGDDAAEAVLGFGSGEAAGGPGLPAEPPSAGAVVSFFGKDARPARVAGKSLSGPLDLRETRYLRLAVDGAQIAEVDCGTPNPVAATLDTVRDAINASFAEIGIVEEVASHDGRLTLTSPVPGAGSTLGFEIPAAQDARERLFGAADSFHVGRDAEPARLRGARDLTGGVDLSERSKLRIAFDGGAAVTVDCAGAAPGATQPEEIVDALNEAFAALGGKIAALENGFLLVSSPTSGGASEVSISQPGGDATTEIFGIRPWGVPAVPATAAHLAGTLDLVPGGADLRARYLLRLAIDGGEPVDVDLRKGAADLAHVLPDEIATAINAALPFDPPLASTDGRRLLLSSPRAGADSRIEVAPRVTVERRRFVTRATLMNEASRTLFGFVSREARGEPPSPARVVGTPDLSRGLDLREERFLRFSVDGGTAVEIDCAGSRPRATVLAEVLARINEQAPVASTDGRRLLLVSPTVGSASRIAFEPPRSADALDGLLGVEPVAVRGRAATGVRFTGIPDLSSGVQLPAGAAVKIGVDGAPPVEAVLSPGGPGLKGVVEIVAAINLALGREIARHDGRHVLLASPTTGTGSRLELAAPAGPNATFAVFGVSVPRSYHGLDGTAARIVGTVLLGETVDLQTARLLRLTVDGGPPVNVDCAAGAAGGPAAVMPVEIAAAFDAAVGVPVAAVSGGAGGRLVLTSPTPGPAGRIVLERHGTGDARQVLFGDTLEGASGEDAKPAVITGEADLLSPVDLSRRRKLRLAVDGGLPIEVDVVKASPRHTALAEVVEALNAKVPGLASATPDDRLRLTSPTAGEESRLEVLPLRTLEVQEYPPEPAAVTHTVRHGGSWAVVHRGVAEVPFEIEIHAPHGAVGPALASRALGVEIRLLAALVPGDTAHIGQDLAGRFQASITAADGAVRTVPGQQLRVTRLSPSLEKPLLLPRGRSDWRYLECLGSRFDQADFDEAHFAGGRFFEPGVFDFSRFDPEAGSPPVEAVFAGGASAAPAVEVTLRWQSHRPGAFEVRLPADLPRRFGGRFNEARFGGREPEPFTAVVSDPPGDENDLVVRVNGLNPPETFVSKLIVSGRAGRVPIGFEAAKFPFRKPRFLALGDDLRAARLYLAEDGVDGVFEIRANEPQEWGNQIAVSVRPTGPATPATWDVEVHFRGDRFESARSAVLGPPLPTSAQELLKPGPIGVLQAKAAGIEVRVTRDRADQEPSR